MSKNKIPKSAYTSSNHKIPVCTVTTENFHQRHPSWRFARSKQYDEFGWTSMKNNLSYLISRLHDLETQTWSDIFKDRKKHHPIEVSKLIPEAQKLLTVNREDIDEVFSLHISAKERLFGIIEPGVGVLDIIWWDPEHKICPSNKKHT